MPLTKQKALQYLRDSLQNPNIDFREDQWESIDAVVNVQKTKENAPQKQMNNAYHQAKNLDGVFDVSGSKSGPVLLVDDVIDSGWTVTVISALLRKDGSGPVFPVALATTGSM